MHIQPEVVLIFIPMDYKKFVCEDLECSSHGTLMYLQRVLATQFPVEIALDRILPLAVQDDFGPITKFIGLVTHFARFDSISNWVICDDDVLYAKDTLLRYQYALETKASSSSDITNSVLTLFSEDYRIFTKFDGDETPRAIQHIQGVDTFLIQTHILKKNPVLQLDSVLGFVQFFHRVCPLSFFQDDYIISFLLAVAGVNVKSLWNNVKVAGHIEGVSLSNYQVLH